jgi:hypothetical protein
LTGALRAEGARLQRTRWRGRLKIAVVALTVGAAAGAIGLMVKRLVPTVTHLLKAPPPPPVTENQIQREGPEPPPASAAKPATKKHKARPKARPAASDDPAPAAAPAPGGEGSAPEAP